MRFPSLLYLQLVEGGVVNPRRNLSTLSVVGVMRMTRNSWNCLSSAAQDCNVDVAGSVSGLEAMGLRGVSSRVNIF